MTETASRVATIAGWHHTSAAECSASPQISPSDAPGSLPRTVSDLDAGFLSKIMDGTVTSVTIIGGDAGTSSRARLALTGEGVPDSVFVKMPAETAATRLMDEKESSGRPRRASTGSCRQR